MKLPTWLGIIVGFVLLLGVKTFLVQVGLFAVRSFSQLTSNPAAWLEHMDDTSNFGWYAIQGLVFMGAVAAGLLVALLTPGNRFTLAAALLLLSLAATSFEQFPRPMGPVVLAVWAGAPALGVCVGVLAAAWLPSSEA